jgi:hypothetical protein
VGIVIFKEYREYKEEMLQDDPMLHLLKDILKPVHPIFENIKLYKGEKSYTVNKDKIFLCLYDEQGNPYPINMLITVLLHEIAHKINHTWGHDDSFYKIFHELQNKAESLKIYNSKIPTVDNYRGGEN